jgi:predicted enzyme related to lactoylglutathione lyase
VKPSISIITIGVDDLERAFAFYRALFDLGDDRIGAGEDHVAFFFDDDFSFVLFPRKDIARTAGKDEPVPGTPGFVLSHRATSPAEVDAILDRVLIAGGAIITPGTQSEWGYSAYFEDSEGNVWEIMAVSKGNT